MSPSGLSGSLAIQPDGTSGSTFGTDDMVVVGQAQWLSFI
jgi:hypothetical protein